MGSERLSDGGKLSNGGTRRAFANPPIHQGRLKRPFFYRSGHICIFVKMHLRLADINDIPAILALISQVVPLMNASGNYQWDTNYPNEAVFRKDIEAMKLWVATSNEQLLGLSAITIDQDPEYAEVGWDLNETAIVTHRLAVKPDSRGQGVGKALLLKAEEEAVRRGIGVLRVDTNSMNRVTQNLFPKLGYRFAGEIGLSYRPGLRFYCYEKRLH